MRIILTAVDDDLYAAWVHYCAGMPGVFIHHGSIFDVGADAIVSPANSFGVMDGGIDMLYLERFGKKLQGHVQRRIKQYHHGELVVGNALPVRTSCESSGQWLIVAPTMRVPRILPADTVAPYLAVRAALIVARELKVESVAFPGMGTGVGRVPPHICGRQVRAAINREGYFPGEDVDIRKLMEDHQRFYMDGPTRDLMWTEEEQCRPSKK